MGTTFLVANAEGADMTIELRSPAFPDGGRIPGRFSRAGEDVPPPLEWSGVPVGTAELALEVVDPDAPTGSFVHWIVAGLSPALKGIDAEHWPSCVQGRNSWGEVRYGGPQPALHGPPHRFVFTLYALAAPSGFRSGDGHVQFIAALRGKQLTDARLIGRFSP